MYINIDPHGLTLIPTLISNYIHYKVWDEITHPFPNFKGCTVEVWEWISNFISPSNTGSVYIYIYIWPEISTLCLQMSYPGHQQAECCWLGLFKLFKVLYNSISDRPSSICFRLDVFSSKIIWITGMPSHLWQQDYTIKHVEIASEIARSFEY